MNKNENGDEVLLAKILDKKEICDRKNKITYSDFLNEKEQNFISKKIRLDNGFWFGGNENSDRKILVFYPEKIDEEIAKKSVESFLNVIRITLPNERIGEFDHRMYLSAIIKIGIDRSRIGDILVYESGADIVVFSVNKDYIVQGLRATN